MRKKAMTETEIEVLREYSSVERNAEQAKLRIKKKWKAQNSMGNRRRPSGRFHGSSKGRKGKLL